MKFNELEKQDQGSCSLSKSKLDVMRKQLKFEELEREIRQEKSSIVEKFFANQFFRFVYRFRWLFVILPSIWGLITIYFGLQVSPLSKVDTLFPEDHWMVKSFFIAAEEFYNGENDKNIYVEFYWGIKGIDATGTDHWNVDDPGKLVYDETLDASPPENQLLLV